MNNAFRENSRRRLVSYAKNENLNWNISEIFITKLITKFLNPLKISLYLKTQVRNRLLNLKKRKTFWEVFWETLKGSFTRVIVSWTIASLFFVNILWLKTTSADIESQLFSIEWDVFIQHLWEEWKKVYSNEILSIWDKIKTWDKSVAEIYFYDNSVSRIAENTKIWIANLTTNLFEIKPIVLKLENWRIWNQIFPWKSSFKIETEKTSVNTKEWIFDIKKSTEQWTETEIQVISKPIEIKSKNWNQFNFSKVYAWTLITSWINWILKDELKKDKWTEKNQVKDIKYREKIVNKIEKIQIRKSKNFNTKTLNNRINLDQDLFSETVNFFQKLKIFSYNKNEKKISKLKKNIFKNLKRSNEIFKSELLYFLTQERQKLKIFIPWDSLYDYKLFISKISLEFDNTWKTIWNIKIERLNEAHELLNLGNEEKLLSVLKKFSKLNNTVNADNKDLEKIDFKKTWKNKIAFEDNLKDKLSKFNDELFLLQSLNNSNISEEVEKEIKKQKDVLAKNIIKLASILTKDTKIQNQIFNTKEYIAIQNARKIKNYLRRVDKFKSPNWQKNKLYWILEEIKDKKENISLLYSLRAKVDWELSFMVSKKIIKIRRLVR